MIVPRETFIVPLEQNPHFIGRKSLLSDLHDKLHEVISQDYNHRIALHGLGGVGKTQTALAYVYKYRDVYNAVYWLTASSQASLLSGFGEIARRTGVVKSSGAQPKEIAHAVLSWLRSQENWLFVLDNLDDVTIVEGLLPSTGEGKCTLITTRNKNTFEIPAKGLEIGDLSLDDAKELLLVRANLPCRNDSTVSEAEEIVRELGYLALAIEQASAYIRETSRNIFRFLPSYRTDRKRLHSRIPRGNWTYSGAVATTWRMSFDQIEKNSVDASRLLRLLAFLNPDGILLSFLAAGEETLPSEWRSVLQNQDYLYEALGELERFSLIKRQGEPEEKVIIHRLVQSVIKDSLTETEFATLADIVISLCNAVFPQTWDSDSRNLCRKYQEQVVPTLSALPDIPSPVLEQVLSRLADFLHDDGKYGESVVVRLKLIEVSTQVNGGEDTRTLHYTMALAVTYRDQRRWPDAITLQEQVVAVKARILGENHLDTWSARGDLAATYRSIGRREEAAEIQRKVLEVRREQLGEDDPLTFRAMGNLAATYRNQKKNHEAMELQAQVLNKRLVTLGERHLDTAKAMSNIAVTYRFLGQVIRAAELEERVLDVRREILGPDHPETLSAMKNLAASYAKMNRMTDAASLLELVLMGRKKALGEDAADTIWAMALLAENYFYQERYEEAVRLQEWVLESRRVHLPLEHYEVMRAMRELATTYVRLGRRKESDVLLKQVADCKAKGKSSKENARKRSTDGMSSSMISF
jgi:tetratricopeptide (TPR) repeat protein